MAAIKADGFFPYNRGWFTMFYCHRISSNLWCFKCCCCSHCRSCQKKKDFSNNTQCLSSNRLTHSVHCYLSLCIFLHKLPLLLMLQTVITPSKRLTEIAVTVPLYNKHTQSISVSVDEDWHIELKRGTHHNYLLWLLEKLWFYLFVICCIFCLHWKKQASWWPSFNPFDWKLVFDTRFL